MMKSVWLFVLISIGLMSCGSDSEGGVTAIPVEENSSEVGSDDGWLIPLGDVKDGGPGKDGIPSLDRATYVPINDPQLDFLEALDLVIGISINGEAKAYPHRILDWHEIVNSEIGGEQVTINYCPLTGTAFGWRSQSNNTFSTYGVSGLLYNANLILYDRETDSYWSQLKLQCVNGAQIGDEPELVSIVETTWEDWKMRYPGSEVLNPDTGFGRSYTTYPYGNYKTDHDYMIFPASPENDFYPRKKRVFALLGENHAKVALFEHFTSGKSIKDNFEGKDLLVIGDGTFFNAFELSDGFQNREFTYVYEEGGTQTVFTDDVGNNYSAFGEVITGPDAGYKLKAARSVTSYWFAIAAFYPDPLLF